jgi:hypothetical protein
MFFLLIIIRNHTKLQILQPNEFATRFATSLQLGLQLYVRTRIYCWGGPKRESVSVGDTHGRHEKSLLTC